MQEKSNAVWGIDTTSKRRRTRRTLTPEEKKAAAALEAWKKKENTKIDQAHREKAEKEKEARRFRKEEGKRKSKDIRDKIHK